MSKLPDFFNRLLQEFFFYTKNNKKRHRNNYLSNCTSAAVVLVNSITINTKKYGYIRFGTGKLQTSGHGVLHTYILYWYVFVNK